MSASTNLHKIPAESLESIQSGLDSAEIGSRQNLNIEAHRRIENTIQNLVDTNPARLQGHDIQKLTDQACTVYDTASRKLNPNECMKLMTTFLQQTLPSGRMEADNITPGRDRNGKLYITETYKDKTVLENLSLISSPEYLACLLQDLTDSSRIDQGLKNTCSVTCSQSHQIVENPAVIVSRITELLLHGKSTNADGQVALTLPAVIPSDERTLINSLYQSAMMNAVDGGYDALNDLVNGRVGQHPGLYARQLCTALNKSTDKPHRVLYQGDADYFKCINSSLNERQDVTAVIKNIGSGTHIWHDVRVVDHKDNFVYFINPWPDSYIQKGNGIEVLNAKSGLCRMSEDQFARDTQYLVYGTNNPADFNFTADGRDEQGGQPSQVFTIEPDLEVLRLLERLRKIQAAIESKKKQGAA